MRRTACLPSGRLIKSITLLVLGLGLLILPVGVSAQPGDHAGQAGTMLVTGTVHSDKGEILPGVTIREKNGEASTVTDANGIFQFRVAGHAILQASHVGYDSKEVPVNGKKIVDILLLVSQASLKDVVVVGYGTQKKISVTGAVSSVSVKDIQMTATPSLSNAIGGKLPGIVTQQAIGEPGYDAASVFIRGMSTWVNAAPLILVDGVERDMNNINAQEIESFTILKDASATAVYGVRGANGVVLIRTKRGTAGKPVVTFRSENAQLTALRMPDYVDAAEYANLMNEGLTSVGLAPRWTDADLQQFKDGSDPYFHPNVNWTDVVLKKHTHQSINNLSINGGSPSARYFVNVGYTVQDGLYKQDELNKYNTNANLKRYNFRSNVDINVSRTFTLGLDIGGIFQNRNYPGNSSWAIFDAMRTVPPLAFPVKNPDGTPGGVGTYIGQNPYGMATQSGYERQDLGTLQGTFDAKWDLASVTKGLSLTGKFAYDRYNEAHDQRFKAFEVKQYLGKNPSSGEDQYTVYRNETPLGYTVLNYSNRAIYTEGRINYDRSFGDHNVTGMLLYNQRDYIDLTAGSSILNLPYRSRGFAGRATYDFANRYLAEFDFGDNGSENFPKGKRFGFFPSVSAGWIISNEKFWHLDIINRLKIRGSYGKVGNDQVGGTRFLFLTTAYRNGTPYNFGQNPILYNGMGEDQTGDNDITWETSTKKNLGLDLEMFKGVLTLQADVYDEVRDGILMQRQQVPGYAGIASNSIPYGNIGKVKNKGLDAMLELKNSTPSGWYYSFRVNFTYAHNRVVENDEPTPKFPYLSAKGLPINQPFGLIATGIFKDQAEIDKNPKQTFVDIVRPGDIKYKDVNGDGVVDVYDQQPIGYSHAPEIMYGFGGTVAHKGIDLSIFFTGTAHTSIFLDGWTMYPFEEGMGNMNVLKEYYDNRWTPDHMNAKYPAARNGPSQNNFQQSTLWQRNAGYLRLQNAEIGYTLSKAGLSRLRIAQLRIFVNGTNLFTWDAVKIVSPESNNGTDGFGGYPLQRILNAGIQIGF